MLLLAGAFAFPGAGHAPVGRGEEPVAGSAGSHRLTRDQLAIIHFAVDRLETQGLRLPDLEFKTFGGATY